MLPWSSPPNVCSSIDHHRCIARSPPTKTIKPQVTSSSSARSVGTTDGGVALAVPSAALSAATVVALSVAIPVPVAVVVLGLPMRTEPTRSPPAVLLVTAALAVVPAELVVALAEAAVSRANVALSVVPGRRRRHLLVVPLLGLVLVRRRHAKLR